jgi:uracil-DNA glycosylase
LFTDEAIRVAAARSHPVFLLWGREAQRKKPLIVDTGCTVVESAHPSPLSARRGFFRSSPFSRANEALAESGRSEIDWSLP